MKILTRLISAAVVAALIFSSCAEDDSVTPMPDPEGPSIMLVDEPGVISQDTVLEKGTLLSIKVTATAGDNSMKTITIQEDGLKIDSLNRLFYNGLAAPANPALLFNDETNQLTWDIDIRLPDDVNFYTYSVVIEDDIGKTDVVSVNVTTANSETPVIEIEGKLLLNSAGDDGQGGLDLITGESVGSSDPNAHIKDEGIDLNLPAPQNWKQQISGVNNSEIRLPDNSSTYAAIESVEDIEEAFAIGTDINVSDMVEVGDEFIIKNDTDHFYIVVTNITVTDGDNNDSIEFSIKQ